MDQRPLRSVLLAVLVVVASALGGACHDPFSNQLFEEDALFLAAIPDAERVTTRVPEADAPALADWDVPPPYAGVAEFPLWTYEASYELNTFIFMLLYTVEYVSTEPIAQRWEDERLWGPIPSGAGDEIWLDMTRAEDRFDYTMSWSEAGVGPDGGLTPFRGSFVAGTVPREGIGSFSFDFELMYELEPVEDSLTEGMMFVDHDNSDGQVLLNIDLDGIVGPEVPTPWSARYAFFWEPVGSGWFEYATVGNVEGTDPDIEEEYQARTRWQADGAGRADARVSGGELAALGGEYHVTECWDSNYLRTYYADDTGFTQPWGDPTSCVFDDQELPSHL